MKDELFEAHTRTARGERTWKLGDVVRLRSGGPAMTVVALYDAATAACAGYGENGAVQGVYPAEALAPATACVPPRDTTPLCWLVWREGTVPRYKHSSRASAEAEAARLAHENPGQEFNVLAVINAARVWLAGVEWARLPEFEDTPF